MTTFQQLHQTASETLFQTVGRGDCYYANLKKSSLTWAIMLVLSRIELTPSIIKGPNFTWRISILLFFQQNFYCTPSSTIKKKKLYQTFSPVWVTFHAELKVEVCLLNWNDHRFFHPWPRRELWRPIQALTSKRKKSCRTEAVGSSLDKTLTNYVNWDWFVSKLWPDQLWQTSFAGDLAVWRPHGVPTRSPVTTLLLWVHTVEDDQQEIVSFSQSAAVWLCQQVQFDSKFFPLSNRLSIVLFTDGGSVSTFWGTFWGLGRRTICQKVARSFRRLGRHFGVCQKVARSFRRLGLGLGWGLRLGLGLGLGIFSLVSQRPFVSRPPVADPLARTCE